MPGRRASSLSNSASNASRALSRSAGASDCAPAKVALLCTGAGKSGLATSFLIHALNQGQQRPLFALCRTAGTVLPILWRSLGIFRRGGLEVTHKPYRANSAQPLLRHRLPLSPNPIEHYTPEELTTDATTLWLSLSERRRLNCRERCCAGFYPIQAHRFLRLMSPLQELAAQHTERERVVRKPILQVCAFCGKRQFLALVTEPQAFVNAS